MYVQPISYSVNMQARPPKKGGSKAFEKITQKIFDAIPNGTIKDGGRTLERWKKIDAALSKPATNRLIMGATALATQPFIDYNNHKVDKETREVSTLRTLAKIIAGTSVGIAVRGSCYKLVTKMTDIKSHKKISRLLLPNKNLNELFNTPKKLSNYRSALSTFLAILVMLFTNFLIDAPLTTLLTNLFNDKRKEKKLELQKKGGSSG